MACVVFPRSLNQNTMEPSSYYPFLRKLAYILCRIPAFFGSSVSQALFRCRAEQEGSNKEQRKIITTRQISASAIRKDDCKHRLPPGTSIRQDVKAVLSCKDDPPRPSVPDKGPSLSSHSGRFRQVLYVNAAFFKPTKALYHCIARQGTISMSFCPSISQCPSTGYYLVFQPCQMKILRIDGRSDRIH